ncbi:hypothetical protein F5Y19DRAFT_472782 [Xylariaceae sp. FL1651]|nr:hypothetical protein F5Y19DRAFT_472782 [Xylariaceae sp. FL1651]
MASSAAMSNATIWSNPLGHHYGHQTYPVTMPAFDTTMEATQRHFRPLIRNYADLQVKQMVYLASNNVTGTALTDLPNNDDQRQDLVCRLFNAFYDGSDTLEEPESQQYRAIMTDDYYPEGAVHLALWKLLMCIEDAQRGVCSIPGYYTRNGPVYRHYPSFAERFADVEDALKESKAACRSLFTLFEFPARLAWNPPKEASRKHVNKVLNNQKNAVQAIGIQNGEKVEGKKNVMTRVFREKTNRIKKRGRQSERARVTNRLIPPGLVEGLEAGSTAFNGSDSLSNQGSAS